MGPSCFNHTAASFFPSLPPPFSSQVRLIDFLSLPHSGKRGLGEGEVGWVRRLSLPTKMAAFVYTDRRETDICSPFSDLPGLRSMDQLPLLYLNRSHPGGTGALGIDPGDHPPPLFLEDSFVHSAHKKSMSRVVEPTAAWLLASRHLNIRTVLWI